QFEPFIHMSKKELGKKFNVKIPKKNDKASTPKLAKKMLNLNTDIENSDEFRKAGISVKTVTIDSKQSKKPSNKRKTTEPFKLQNYFNFQDIVEVDWEDADSCEYLTSAKFRVAIFEETSNDGQLFKGVRFWRVPSGDLNRLVYDPWQRTIDTLNKGVPL